LEWAAACSASFYEQFLTGTMANINAQPVLCCVCALLCAARCRRLVLEWNAYIARTSSLRRVFVSVKGFYYQVRFSRYNMAHNSFGMLLTLYISVHALRVTRRTSCAHVVHHVLMFTAAL
jgi:hypothetical protein